MYCTKKVTDDLVWVGGNDRRLAMFEGVYSVPNGVSYNSYLLLDDTTVLFDAVDKAVSRVFFENLEHGLAGRKLDYIVVQHMEPDHSATLDELLRRWPDTIIVCNAKTAAMIGQFFGMDVTERAYIVKEGSRLNTGHHSLTFVMAPMVHWPEVMVTYDSVDRILFSADAFGTFGALNGAIFADEVDFDRDYMDEARRYYTNIVGKYGGQVQAMLKKLSSLDIDMICPLHGFVWRANLRDILDKYEKWSTYTPEEEGVMIAYASIYGNTENAAEVLSAKLRDRGVKTVMYDVSVTPESDIVAAAFRFSHLVFASATCNAGIFPAMETLIRELAAHNLQSRTVALIQNGSWAPASGKLMGELVSSMKNMTLVGNVLDIRSALDRSRENDIEALADAIAGTMPKLTPAGSGDGTPIESAAFYKLSYGLFVLSARDGDRDNGCITNTVIQVTGSPKRIAIAVIKANFTHDMIMRTGVFNVSVLTESAPFKLFQQFGFQSGRDVNKFAGDEPRSANGLCYIPEHTNALISAKVIKAEDYGTHTLFVADVTEARVLSRENSVTYEYYQQHIKPKPQPKQEPKQEEKKKRGWVCKVCGYFYEGDELPEDFTCPLCKHSAEDFERVE